MTQKCDLCGRAYSPDKIWKHKSEQVCSRCVQIKLLQTNYTVFPPEAREELKSLTKELDMMLDKQREEECLPLLKKGLSFMNGYILREMDWGGLDDGIFWFNDILKKAGRLETTRFVVERTILVGNTTFIVVLFLKKNKEPESWKFFLGHIPGL